MNNCSKSDKLRTIRHVLLNKTTRWCPRAIDRSGACSHALHALQHRRVASRRNTSNPFRVLFRFAPKTVSENSNSNFSHPKFVIFHIVETAFFQSSSIFLVDTRLTPNRLDRRFSRLCSSAHTITWTSMDLQLLHPFSTDSQDSQDFPSFLGNAITSHLGQLLYQQRTLDTLIDLHSLPILNSTEPTDFTHLNERHDKIGHRSHSLHHRSHLNCIGPSPTSQIFLEVAKMQKLPTRHARQASPPIPNHPLGV